MNNYRTFFKRVIVFVLLLFICDLLAGIVFKKLELVALRKSPFGMSSEYTMWKVNTDGIIIGSSEALHSYNPRLLEDELGISFYNCGLEGTGFFYSAAMIEGILSRYSPQMIIWAIEPNVLNSPSIAENDRLSELAPFCRSNDVAKRALQNKSKYEAFKLVSQCYVYNSRLLPFLYKIIMPDYTYEYGRYAPMYGEITDVELYANSWADDFSNDVMAEMTQIVDKCIENKVHLFFVLTPRYERGDYAKLTTYKHLQKLCQEKNITIIDELYHDEELLKPCYFKDKSHLNKSGADVFNQKLVKLLK